MVKMNKKILLEKLGIEKEPIGVMLISFETLKKDWDNKYDERWNKY